MRKPIASEETVLRFVEAVYPGFGELSLSTKCEAEILLDAIHELTSLRTDNAELNRGVETYNRLPDEQVGATNVVTKELNAMYAELGVYRHPDKPDRGPDMIAALMKVVEAAEGMIGTPDHGYEKGIFVTRDRFEKVRAALAAPPGEKEEG